MALEKYIEVKTFVTPQGWEDKVNPKELENDNSANINNLKDLNRMILKKYVTLEVTSVMHYEENGMKRLVVSFYEEGPKAQNSQ